MKHDFKPFDRVLVRDTPQDLWRPEHFFRYDPTPDISGPYQTTDALFWNHCIPYDDYQHLCGTNRPAIPWKPTNGDPYYIVRSMHGFLPELRHWEGSNSDIIDFQLGNCFRTEAEAKEAAAHLDKAFIEFLSTVYNTTID